MAAYTDSSGAVSPEFNQAIAIYMWAWFIVSVLFTVAAFKTTWVIFIDMLFVDLCLLLLACGFMVGNQGVLTAGYSIGMVVAFLSCKLNLSFLLSGVVADEIDWAGCSAMWDDTPTPVKLPTFAMGSVV